MGVGGIDVGNGEGKLSAIGSRASENVELDALDVTGDCCRCRSGSWIWPSNTDCFRA